MNLSRTMTYRYAAYVLGMTKAFGRLWAVVDRDPRGCQPYIDRFKVVARKQYKRLAKQRHPDCGGSDETMAELNLALEVIESMHIPKKVTPCPSITSVRVTIRHSGTTRQTTTGFCAEAPSIRVSYTRKSR